MADLKYVKIRGVPLIDSSGNVDGVDISQFKSDFDSHHKLSTLDIDGHKDWNNKDIINLAALKGAGLFHSPNPAQFLNSSSAPQSIYVKGLKATASYSGISDEVGRIEGIHGVFTNATINMVNANEISVRGSQIDPTRINNHILLWDGQERIDNGDLTLVSKPAKATYFKESNEPEFSSYFRINGNSHAPHFNVGPLIRVTPGDKIYIQFSGRTPDESEVDGEIHPYLIWFDKNKERVGMYNPGQTRYTKGEPWKKTVRSTIVPSNVRFVRPSYAVNFYPTTAITDIANLKVWRDANFNSDLSAKNISADAVIIKDGGTVDGVDVSAHTHDGTAIGGANIPLSNILISSINWNNQSIFGMNTLEAKAINLSSGVFPILNIERTTPSDKTGGIYGVARLIRKTDGTPQNGIGAGFYFAAPNGDNVSKHAGMFGGGLGDVTPGAEKGEIILSPSYAGQDPYQRKDFIIRAVSSTTAEAELNGNISVSGEINVNGSRFFTEGNVTRLRANDSHDYMTFGFSDASGKPHLYIGPNILRPTTGSTAIDLGGSPSNYRFRNLYLSGNIFLDGNVQCQSYKSDTPFAFTTLSGAAQSIYVKGIKATSSYSGISSTAGVIEADEFRVTGGYILNDGNKLTPGGGLETTAGVHASKFNLNGKFTIEYNSTENSLDFVYV